VYDTDVSTVAVAEVVVEDIEVASFVALTILVVDCNKIRISIILHI
jgi:hypothetical protein